jgi:hypothetical protein
MKLLGHLWKVRNMSFDEREVHSGSADRAKQIIRIDPTLNQQERESTILHEVIEVISEANELNLKHHAICTLEVGLFSFFADNGIDLSVLTEEYENELRLVRQRNPIKRITRKVVSKG